MPNEVTNGQILEAIRENQEVTRSNQQELRAVREAVRENQTAIHELRGTVHELQGTVQENQQVIRENQDMTRDMFEMLFFLKDHAASKEDLARVEQGLQNQMNDLKGDFVVFTRKQDAKVTTLAEILRDRKTISSEDMLRVLAPQPFPSA